MLSPAQVHLRLYNFVRLTQGDDQLLAFARTIDAKLRLGLLVKGLEMHYHSAPGFYPVAGRLSNLTHVTFAGALKHYAADVSFMRLFAGSCRSLTHIRVAFCGFSLLSDLACLVWSFPALRSLTVQQCAWGSSRLDALPSQAFHPGHVSMLTDLQVSVVARASLFIRGRRC